MASTLGAVSGTDSPYKTGSYTVEQNDKNTLTMTGYFQLLATQLQNQDMSNPMDNSELMAQMTQMAMVQSMTSMTEAMKSSTAVNTQTYAASLVGQEVTMAVTKENSYGQETPVDVKYAKVEWVDFTSGAPTIKIEGDDKKYSLTHLVGMGRVPNPFKDQTGESSGTDTGKDDETDKTPGTGEGTSTPETNTRLASKASSFRSAPPTAGYLDESDDRKTSGSNVNLAAAMSAAVNLADLDKETLEEHRRAVKELVSSGAFSSPDQIPDLTVRR